LSYEFKWSIFFEQPYGEWMIEGILTTIKLGILCWSIALFIGVIIGTLRHSPWKLARFFSTGYTEFFRNIPLLVQLFFWYFAAPRVLPERMVKLIYHDTLNVEFWVVVIGLSIYTSSRVAEQIRAGIGSISKEQFDAALSTGLTPLQMYRFVIVPLSIRIMMPPLTTEFLTTFKNTSLAMTVGVLETTFMSQQIEAYTFHGLEATTGASLVYITITMIIMLIMTNVEKRLSVPGFIIRQR
jgi:glutamate/aspartate transport system permease protein